MVRLFSTVCASVIIASSIASAAPLVERRAAANDFNTLMTWDEAIVKAKDLVGQLSLEEKVDLASGIGWAVGNCVGNIKAVPKINFPGLCLQDAPTGVRYALNVSAFPASINVAATFDKTLMYKNGQYMAEEARGKGVNVLLAPVANMLRAPAGGRNWEGQGADPYLTGISTAQQIKGIQDTGVMATIKHFIGNEQEIKRDWGNSVIDQRTLMEIYVRPFKHAIDAGAASVMCSYNKINGTYACESPEVMSLLKDQLGFQGFVMSDWWATHSTVEAANSRLDMVMPGTTGWEQPTFWWGKNLVKAVNDNKVQMNRIDDMAVRILTPWVKLGQINGFPTTNFNSFNPNALPQVNVQENHKQHIREVGAASTILLKNEGNILPLSGSKLKKIAVIGSDAFQPKEPLNSAPDHGSVPSGTLAQGWGSGTTNFPYIIAPIDGMQGPARNQNIAINALNENYDMEAIKRVAAEADVSVVFVNANSGEGYITVDGNPGDRNNLTLWNNGDNVILASASVRRTVVVVHSPSAIDMPWINHPNVAAVIYALFPGQETGNAIADVLFGRVNPSGRLPFTVGKDRTQYSADVEYVSDQIVYKEGIFVDYRWNDKFSVAPLFPFGHGLSYTTFSYSPLTLSTPNLRVPTRTLMVSLSITNTGSVVGNEVPQLYIGFPEGVDQPPKQLKGFERVRIAPGETSKVTFRVTSDDLSIWNVAAGAWEVPRGVFKAMVGASSGDLRVEATFTI
ncbi:hypothetical protein HDU67_009194 [Dinochytrium kinnereticum]|nr:hypothetical protein HDU67_009194 [Dinochytrium kinnereticum]